MYLFFFSGSESKRPSRLASLTGVLSNDWASWEEGEEPQIGLGFAVLILCGGGFSVFSGTDFWVGGL